MTDQDILSKLAAFTDAGEHTKFKLLQNCREYRYYRKVERSTRVVVKFLEKSASKQFKDYCKDVERGVSDVYKLLAYKYLIRIYNCYLEELKIVQDMIDEYECYLLSGNWSDFVFGFNRTEDKQWDHRG